MSEITISNLLDMYGIENCRTKLIKSVKAGEYAYTLYINLNRKDTISFKENFSNPQADGPSIFINSFPMVQVNETKITETDNEIAITFNNKLVSENILFFKDNSDFEKYLTIFFSCIKIEDLFSKETKIIYKIYSQEKINFSSSIFSDKDSEQLEIYSIFKNERLYKDQKIIGVIETVPEKFRFEKQKEIIEGFLSIISDRTINKGTKSECEYVISLGKRSYITGDKIIKSIEVIDALIEIENFIFLSSEKYYDRLNIFRNIFSDKIENKVEINAETLKEMLDDAKLHYNLFIGDKIKHFVLEKQKVTEDYLKLSGEIVKRINAVTEELPKQLLTIIGVIITTFFLKGLDQSSKIWIIPLLALIYLLAIIIFKSQRGWFSESKNVEMQKELMDESYKELYTLDDKFINKLNTKYIQPKLKDLKRMEKLSLTISSILLIAILAWFLWA
ncbi:hypothetical protein TolaII67_05245 [Lactococcus lactis subsp. lactis]|uniref:hypothetical protein n=1 Tax=Lactococcus lactis TaxID=1358 RepID=UPI00300DD220